MPSIMVCHSNRLLVSEVHATTCCPYQYHTKTVMQQQVASPVAYAITTLAFTSGIRTMATQQHVTFTGGIRKRVTQEHVAFASGTRKNSHATTRCRPRWKTKNNLAKTVMQQHAILTNGKRKTKHATTRYLHQWYTQNSHATNTLPVVHTKQSHHNMLPSPIVHTKTVIQQHVVYTNSYPTVRCFDQRSCNNSMLSSPVVSAKTVPKNRSPSPAEYNREF